MNAKIVSALLFTIVSVSFGQTAGSFTTLKLTSTALPSSKPGSGVLQVSSGGAWETDIGGYKMQTYNSGAPAKLLINPFGGDVEFSSSKSVGAVYSPDAGLDGTSCFEINHAFSNMQALPNCYGGKVNFAVNGSAQITGKLFIGTAGWSVSAPDYVFGSDYKLAPLSDVEAFVKSEHHLPGIASAGAMEGKGSVDLVQMNMDLLKKVEELTLYVIDQNKKLEAIQNQVGAKN